MAFNEKKPEERQLLRSSLASGRETDRHNSTTPIAPTNEAPAKFLIGSLQDTAAFLNCCPYAATIEARSLMLNAWVIIQVRCKRWSCRHCGERLMAHYARKVTAAEPTKFITLTTAIEPMETPRDAYDKSRRGLTQLAAILRRRLGEFEYFRVLETTKRGWPHYHLAARCPYIPQPELSREWDRLTGARIVDVRMIKRVQDVYRYVVKYLSKQKSIPWTKRRVSWSRNFWKADGFQPAGSLVLASETFTRSNPAQVLCWNYPHAEIETYSRDCWILHSRPDQPPGEEG